jgi:hypothetical protein
MNHLAYPDLRGKAAPKFTLRAVIGEGEAARAVEIDGRPAWLLGKLVEAGERGITAAELPAGLRLSHFAWRLRRHYGLSIETVQEPNTGSFGGSHGRYRLVSPVQILADDAPCENYGPLIDKFGNRHRESVLTSWSPKVLAAMGVRRAETADERD